MGDSAEVWECPECGATLDISKIGFYKEVSCPSCAHSEIVHTQLANFKLTGVLGIGGMSVVFKANDIILNRPLAIKVLNDTYKDSPERIARFENECAMMARVRHANVVSVYSAGWARGQFYIAMEFVKGRDLEHVVRNGKPMSPSAALSVTREVALGLQAAAQAGLLHRDMKPGNILISRLNGRAKVLDFGLSLGAHSEDTEEVIWATPFYVAPETLMREQEDVRTDIYALGMTLRFLLTGSDRLTQNLTSFDELLKAKRKLPSFEMQMPGATSALVDLVDHMTAFAPTDRPPSYQELLQELDETLAILAQEDAIQAPERISRQRSIRRACIAGSIFLGLVGACITVAVSLPDPVQKSIAIEKFTVQGELDRFEQGVKALSREDWEGAKSLFSKAAGGAAEPTLAAASALLCYYIALTDGDHAAMNRHLQNLHQQTAREEKVSSSAVSFFAQLKRVDEVLSSENADESLSGITNPALLGIVQASRIQQMSSPLSKESLTERMAQAKTLLEREEAHFPGLSRRLDRLEELVLNQKSRIDFTEVHAALQAHDFRACDIRLAKLMNDSSLNAEEKNRLSALLEIRDVASIVVDVLKKRAASDYRAAMSPEDMRRAAAKLREDLLEKEVYCLALLMKGDYAAAFAADPYGSDAETQRPFAVLMRHWRSLLHATDAE